MFIQMKDDTTTLGQKKEKPLWREYGEALLVALGLALVIFSGIREKLAHADPPRCFRGIAIALVTGGLLSLAFMGFSGLVKLPY